MPDAEGAQSTPGFHVAKDQCFTAPRGVLVHGVVIVPVLRLAARIAGVGGAAARRLGGSASAEAIGVWTLTCDQGRRFFPFSETPPGGCESWPRWWESQPSLEGEALRSAAEARASADRSR